MTEITITKALGLDDYDLPAFIAKAADAHEITKAELGELLNRRVVARKRQEESFAQAYTRLLAEGQDYAGAQAFRVYRGLPGLDESQAAAWKALEAPRTSAAASGQGPLDRLNEMAAAYQKSNPAFSRAQAFARMVDTPEGMALYRADKAARLA